jgi:anaerobic selenocysteine-containing dehydrogenase
VKPVVPSGTYIPEYILSKEESPLKVLVVQAASPVTQWPNTEKTLKAFDKIPFKVCIELELTDTAKLCDIVLPATFIFEHDNLVHSELHRIVQFAPKIVEPRGEAKSELDIWQGVAERLGLDDYFEITERDAIRLALDSTECRHISIEDLEQHPEGIRTTNPAVPFTNRQFNTPSGKVELFSKQLQDMGYDPLPTHVEPAESLVSKHILNEEYPLTMITGRLRERLHSQYTTVEVGATVKSYAHCTSCKKCIEECPDEAITLIQPSPHMIQKDVAQSGDTSASLRKELGGLVAGLAVNLPDDQLDIPPDLTHLLVPSWDLSKCIGCSECQLDVCPYDVVTETIRMPPKTMAGIHRTFLRMHPNTADNLGLRDGDRVEIESIRGRVSNIRLELTEDIDPRVVWSSDGWWQEDGNINLLTDDKHTDFGSTPGFNSVLVRVFKE